jgi:hypothetical protein
MLSNIALRNFDHYMKTTPARDRGYVVSRHGFPMRARPVGAYDSSPNKRAIRLSDFSRGGALDNASPLRGDPEADCEALVKFLETRLSPADHREAQELIGSLRASCENPSPAGDEIDPENGLPAPLANRRASDDFEADPEAARKNPEALRRMQGDDLDDDLAGGMDTGRP